MLNQLLKNCIICRIIDLSCCIISLENAAEFPIFCHTLSEALLKQTFHLILLCFHHKKCAKSHKQSQFTSKFIPTSWYFQIGWIAPYYAGLLIRSRKKSNFAGFLGANERKNRPILRHFRGNVWGKLRRKSIGKEGRFCGYFLGKILSDIDRFCADQTSVFNVFLTEVIIYCSFNNKTLQKRTNGKAFNIMASAQFFATQCTPGSFRTLFARFSDEVSR